LNAIKSFADNQHKLLKSIITLHCPDGIECDVTYGHGVFYKNLQRPRLRFDVEPKLEDVIKADSQRLPVKTNSMNSIMFDPPFLTYVRDGRNHKEGQMILSRRFGGFWHYDELATYYKNTLIEIQRVLQKAGVLIVKCQDVRYNHKLRPTHIFVHDVCKSINLFLKDLFVLCRDTTLPFPAKGKQRHARIHHSYFMVFTNK